MVKDSISQLLVTIKHAGASGEASVAVPHSNFIERILETLQKEGFIKSFARRGKKTGRIVDVELAYVDGKPRIHDARRVSRLSRRMYKGFRSLRSYKNGVGLRILTTPKGVMSDTEARKEKVGGEVLFELW